jgi:preprotein translocase subunit SecG
MGVKQTTDVLEKGTWVLAAVVGLLCLFSAVFVPRTTSTNQRVIEKVNATQSAQPTTPANTVPANPNTTPAPAPGK